MAGRTGITGSFLPVPFTNLTERATARLSWRSTGHICFPASASQQNGNCRKLCEEVTGRLFDGIVWVPWDRPLIDTSGLAENDVMQEQENEGGMQEVLKADNAPVKPGDQV